MVSSARYIGWLRQRFVCFDPSCLSICRSITACLIMDRCTNSCEYTSNDGTTGRMCDPTCEDGDPHGVLFCDTKSGQHGSNCRYCFNDVDRAMKFDTPVNRAIM